jgi:putative ABC transport system permease protein
MSKYIFIAEPPTEFVYLPSLQTPQPRMTLIARSAGDPASLVAPLREVVRGLDANQPIYDVRTMEELYTMRAVTTFKVLLQTVSAMGLMGLGLAIVGLYGLVAYAASRRTKEIGIRMAIGANRTTVLRMMLRQGVSLAVAGLAVGLAAGVGVGGLLQAAFLSSGRRFDPVALVIVAAVVLAVTAAAVYIPARRASRLDPMRALRYE